MRKRWFRGTALTLCAALVIAGCSDSSDTSETNNDNGGGQTVATPTFEAGTTMDVLQKKGRITVGVKYDQPGFGLQNPTNNQIEGFDVEIAKLMAQAIYGGTVEEAASKVDFIEAVSRNREPFIDQSRVDIIVATYTINTTRKQIVDFAGPYYVAHGDIMVRTADNTIRSVTDLNGKAVCTARGSTYPASLRTQAPQAQVTELDTYTACAEALRDNRVQAVSTDNVILAGLVQTNAGAFKLVNTSYTDEPYGIGLKRGDDVFRNFLNDRLEQIYENGEWKRAYESTLGRLGLPTPEPPPVDRYASTGTTGTTATTAAGGATTTSAAPSGTTSTTAAP